MNFGNVRSAPSLALTPEASPFGVTQQGGKTSMFGAALEIDWASVGLGLVALVAVLGLIPFWMWIYFVYNPPIR
jgi:hypothetical protein